VYIDATSVAAADRRFESEVTRLIRSALQPFELQLERVQVHVRSSPEGHVCRLHARAGRGRTIVIESSAQPAAHARPPRHARTGRADTRRTRR
jgi:hypothetical protein